MADKKHKKKKQKEKKKDKNKDDIELYKHYETFYEAAPPGYVRVEEEKPEDCIPNLPENEQAREFLSKAPSKGLWMPLGKEVKVMKCWRCKSYGHRTGDKECPMFVSGNQTSERFRMAHEDPMHDFIVEKKKTEKEQRIEQLKALLEEPTTSESDSSDESSDSSSETHRKHKKGKKRKHKTRKSDKDSSSDSIEKRGKKRKHNSDKGYKAMSMISHSDSTSKEKRRKKYKHKSDKAKSSDSDSSDSSTHSNSRHKKHKKSSEEGYSRSSDMRERKARYIRE